METKIAKLTHWGIEFEIEYKAEPIKHSDAWQPCGNGVWLYDSLENKIDRNSIGYCHELPYSYRPETWNPKGRFHKVVASSRPLWIWWGEGCLDLKWGNSGIALPKIK